MRIPTEILLRSFWLKNLKESNRIVEKRTFPNWQYILPLTDLSIDFLVEKVHTL